MWIFYFQVPICTFLGGMKSWSIQIRQRLIFKYPYISVMSHISANFFPFHFFLQSNQNLGYELRTIWTKSFEGSWEHLSFPLWSCVFAYKEFVHSITMTSKQFWFQSIRGKKSYHDQLHSVNFSVDIIAVFFFYLKWFTFWSELFWSCSTPLSSKMNWQLKSAVIS